MHFGDSPEVVELFRKIASLRTDAEPFVGFIYRSVAMKYANESDLLTGDGAARFGGRWNPIGRRAIYGSLDVITASHEAYQEFARYGFAGAIRPRVLVGIHAELTDVLNLSDGRLRRKLGFSLKELLEEDWRAIQAGGSESWTQTIGRGCFAAGFQAIRVPSARRRKGENLVVFPERSNEPGNLTALHADELPSPPKLPST